MQARWPDGHVNPPPRAFRNLKLAIEQGGLPAEDLPPLLTWTISSWSQLRSNVFSFDWKKPYGPPAPDLDFIIKKLPAIYQSFLRAREVARPINEPRRLPRSGASPARPDFAAGEAARIRLGMPEWDK